MNHNTSIYFCNTPIASGGFLDVLRPAKISNHTCKFWICPGVSFWCNVPENSLGTFCSAACTTSMFDAKEQQLNFKLLTSCLKLCGRSPFQLFVTGIFFGHGSYFFTISEGWNEDRPVNRKLCPSTELFLHLHRPKKHPHYCRQGPDPSIQLHPSLMDKTLIHPLLQAKTHPLAETIPPFLWLGEHKSSKCLSGFFLEFFQCLKNLGDLSGNCIIDVQLIICRGLQKFGTFIRGANSSLFCSQNTKYVFPILSIEKTSTFTSFLQNFCFLFLTQK